MNKEIKNLTYIKGKVRIELEYSGKYPIPRDQEEYWIDATSIDNCQPEKDKLFYITETRPVKTGRYPKEHGGWLYLRELNPNPSKDEVMYSEDDIDKAYFAEATRLNKIAKLVLNGDLPDGTEGIKLLGLPHQPMLDPLKAGTNLNDLIASGYYTNADHMPGIENLGYIDQQCEETLLPTNEATVSPEEALFSDIVSFLPDIISSKLRFFKNVRDTLDKEFSDDISRIINTIPASILAMNADNPFVMYFSDNGDNAFTFDVTVEAIASMVTGEEVTNDIVKSKKYDWNEVSDIIDSTRECVSQLRIWAIDTLANLRKYDSHIDLFKLMGLYEEIGTNHVKHKNGRGIFDNFVRSNKFARGNVRIGEDIFEGYYAKHVLFIKDCEMNYLRIYIFDVLTSEDELFNNDCADPADLAVFATDIEFDDTILDTIQEIIFGEYEKAFLRYNMSCEEEDTSRDV